MNEIFDKLLICGAVAVILYFTQFAAGGDHNIVRGDTADLLLQLRNIQLGIGIFFCTIPSEFISVVIVGRLVA